MKYNNKNDSIKMVLLSIHKPTGMRMGELIEFIRREYKINKLCYSGRLDEMAEGQVLILTDEDCKNCRIYDKKNKIYEFSVLAGISTDTGDILGIHQNTNLDPDNIIEESIKNTMLEYGGKQFFQKRPFFSSIKNKIIVTGEIPEKEILIEKCEYLGSDIVNTYQIMDKLNLLNDPDNKFRKNEILDNWEKYLDNEFKIYNFRVYVSSGTYIRQLIMDVSSQINYPLTAFNIKRLGYY